LYCFALKHRVAVLNLSYGHISKTKEDRPIVTEEHYITIASDRSCCQPKQTFSRRKQIHEGIGPNPRFGTVKL